MLIVSMISMIVDMFDCVMFGVGMGVKFVIYYMVL